MSRVRDGEDVSDHDQYAIPGMSRALFASKRLRKISFHSLLYRAFRLQRTISRFQLFLRTGQIGHVFSVVSWTLKTSPSNEMSFCLGRHNGSNENITIIDRVFLVDTTAV